VTIKQQFLTIFKNEGKLKKFLIEIFA